MVNGYKNNTLVWFSRRLNLIELVESSLLKRVWAGTIKDGPKGQKLRQPGESVRL